MELPKASYLVCASPRGGTELLCRCLAAAGVAGCPQEYFLAEDPARLPDWQFWEEGPYAAGHDVADRESYLSLVNRLGATPNGVFGAKIHWNTLRWALAKFSEMPRFSGLDWAATYQVVYEELGSPDGHEQTVRGVLAHLGLDDYQGPIPAPRMRRQSNDLNEAWVAAYLADKTSRQER